MDIFIRQMSQNRLKSRHSFVGSAPVAEAMFLKETEKLKKGRLFFTVQHKDLTRCM